MNRAPALPRILAAALALGLAACGQAPPPAEVLRPVEIVAVGAPGTLDRQVYSGEVRARYETDLGFRINGKLMRRLVDIGATVKQGQPLAELDPADVRLSADAAQSQVNATETEYQFARAELDRYRSLLAQKFISQAAFEAKQNAYNSAAAKLEQAKSQYAVTRNQAGYATLHADADGVITATPGEPGQVLAAGQPAVRLARSGEKEVVINVPENRLPELRAAQELAVATWVDPKRIYRARVREISPAADAATRTYTTKVSILDAGPEVLWGMTANVLLQRADAGVITVLPLAAVAQRDSKPTVWVADRANATVTPRAIEIGQYREDGVTVLSGLKQGEWVVAAGVHKLLPGQKVRLPEAAQLGRSSAASGAKAS